MNKEIEQIISDWFGNDGACSQDDIESISKEIASLFENKTQCFADSKERFNQQTIEEAFCYQFHNQLRVMYAVSKLDKVQFEEALKVLETQINSYKIKANE